MNVKSLKLSQLPTPINKLEILSEELGQNLWIKRDDLTGFAFGGNKTRKLDLLIADALDRKYDTLVAVGANQSNFCRIVAAYGSRYGLATHLVLGGMKPDNPTGNLRVAHIYGAIVHHYDTSDWERLEEKSRQLSKELFKQGKKVYLLPIGGSTPLGSSGYIEAIKEIKDFESENNISFDKLFVVAGSGGMQAGLIVGKVLYKWPGAIIGISVSWAKPEQEKIIYSLAKEIAKIYHVEIDRKQIIIDDNYIGPGYGQSTPEAEAAIKLFAQKEGIMLDSYYTGKGAAGLLDYIEQSKVSSQENILFLHSGGNIQLFE
ncbi:D-cysteine desulfhydrase family protein [Patescibacteria group bacterium]|nr:D-cysteine desulfhydrase family protein [Patescibacteria group bacterium]